MVRFMRLWTRFCISVERWMADFSVRRVNWLANFHVQVVIWDALFIILIIRDVMHLFLYVIRGPFSYLTDIVKISITSISQLHNSVSHFYYFWAFERIIILIRFFSLINCGHIPSLSSLHRTSLTDNESHCYLRFLVYAHLIRLRADSLNGLVRSCRSAPLLVTPSLSGRYTQFLLRNFYGSRVYLRSNNFLWQNIRS
jgi:hypothetical protein